MLEYIILLIIFVVLYRNKELSKQNKMIILSLVFLLLLTNSSEYYNENTVSQDSHYNNLNTYNNSVEHPEEERPKKCSGDRVGRVLNSLNYEVPIKMNHNLYSKTEQYIKNIFNLKGVSNN